MVKDLQFPLSTQPIPSHAKMVFKGQLFEVWQWQQKMFDGSIRTFEKTKRNPSVGIIALTPDNKLIITKQSQPQMKPFISLLGGVVDDGESIIAAVEREMLEEAGMKAEKIDFWYSTQPVSKIEWPIYMFIARNCHVVQDQRLDSGEKIQLDYISWSEFIQLISQENFRDKETAFRLLKAIKNNKLAQIKKTIFGL